MSQLVFQANAGGSITFNGTNTAGTYNLTVPAANGTLLYEDGDGNITVTNLDVTGQLTITGTSALGIPVGNTAERPSPEEAGQIRYNTDGGGLYEAYVPSEATWKKFVLAPEGDYPIDYVVIGGGGGGNYNGGGAGQFTASTLNAIPGTVFTVTIGAGGPAGTNGSNSLIVGNAQGIGGGSNGVSGNGYTPGSTTGTDGAGGGGGSSGNGGNGYNSGGTIGIGGTGGSGTETLITGTSQTLAGGGGGGGYYQGGVGTAGGGNGGMGNPAGPYNTGGSPGSVNTGGGGGGSGLNTGLPAGAGGSGKAMMKMLTASYTGTTTGSPTIITSGSYTVLVFNSSGTYTA